MTYSEFMNSKAHQSAAAAYTAAHGGMFVCEEPGDRLVYVDPGGVPYTPPDGATEKSVLQELQREKPISGLWPELEYDPEQDY